MLTDHLLHWLQIKLVADRRPDDAAAQDTVDFFAQVLQEEHGVDIEALSYRVEENVVHVYYVQAGQRKWHMFSRDAAEQLWRAVETEPRYGQ